MANFGGHAIPGSFFLLFGFWLTVKYILQHHWRTKQPKGRPIMPTFFKKMNYFEGGLAMFASFVGGCLSAPLRAWTSLQPALVSPWLISGLVSFQVLWWSSLCRTDHMHISTAMSTANGSSWWTGSTVPCICSLASMESCWLPALQPDWCLLVSTALHSPLLFLSKVRVWRNWIIIFQNYFWSFTSQMCLVGNFLPCSSRLPVLLPRPHAAPSGLSHPLLASGGCVWWIGQHHVGGVHKRQHHSGALRRVYVHSSRLMVLPGKCQMSKLWSDFPNPCQTQCQRTFTCSCQKNNYLMEEYDCIWLFNPPKNKLDATKNHQPTFGNSMYLISFVWCQFFYFYF